jgi:3-hydroxy-D-aspartate aldolase
MTYPGPNADLVGQPDSRRRLLTPALVLDVEALERNIRTMADIARERGIALRPHAKTHKSIRIAKMQMEAGALGICVATLGEAEILVDGGISGVLITSPVVPPAKVQRLAALNCRADGLMVVSDHAANVDALAGAARESGKTLAVVVDLDVGIHRSGVATVDDGLALAQRIEGCEGLTFGGVQAYTGQIQHVDDYGERLSLAAEQNRRIRELVDKLKAAGLAPPLVSGAGTGSHDFDSRIGDLTEMQVGSYIFTDVQYNTVALRQDGVNPFEPSLFVQATIISANSMGFVTADAGLKRFAMDGPKPEVFSGAPPGSTYAFKGDEHGIVVFQDAADTLPVGTVITCLTSHCDPTVNLYDLYHVVRGDTLIGIWPVDARGAI